MTKPPTVQILNTQCGAALLMVIVVTLALSLLITSASVIMEQRLAIATDAKNQAKQKAAAYAQLHNLSYLLATQRITRAGVSRGTKADGLARNEDGQWLTPIIGDEIRVDGYEYKVTVNGVELTYSIQAENGLIPLNSGDQTWLKRYLEALGHSKFEAEEMAQKLADYADADDWARPAGAESHSYAQKGLSKPSNYLLQHCNRPLVMINWDISFDCSLSRIGSMNINAIPYWLLYKLWPSYANDMYNSRQDNSYFFASNEFISDVGEAAVLDESLIRTFASGKFHIKVVHTFGDTRLKIEVGKGSNLSFQIYSD